MDVRVTLVGMREFQAKLKRLGTAGAKKARAAALMAGGEIVREDATRRAHRAPGGPTYPSIGHMADSIMVKTTISKASETEVSVGPDASHWYAVFVERGVPAREIPAQPFLRPALDENLAAVQAKIRQVLRAEIKRLTGARL